MICKLEQARTNYICFVGDLRCVYHLILFFYSFIRVKVAVLIAGALALSVFKVKAPDYALVR